MQIRWTYKWEILSKLILKVVHITFLMNNIKYFDSSLLEIAKKSYKNIDIYNIDYITIQKLMILKILVL